MIVFIILFVLSYSALLISSFRMEHAKTDIHYYSIKLKKEHPVDFHIFFINLFFWNFTYILMVIFHHFFHFNKFRNRYYFTVNTESHELTQHNTFPLFLF